MVEVNDAQPPSRPRWWLSDGFLGALVVLLTVATAFSAYQGSLASIEGDDLDFLGQKALVLATSSYLSGNTEFLEDLHNYDSYRLFVDRDPEEAAIYLDRASEALRSGMERPGGPFDENYFETRYNEARELIAEVGNYEQQANQADDKTKIFELAGLIFAIGLAAAAWAALVGTGRRIRTIFLLVALIAIIAGIGIILQIVPI